MLSQRFWKVEGRVRQSPWQTSGGIGSDVQLDLRLDGKNKEEKMSDTM